MKKCRFCGEIDRSKLVKHKYSSEGLVNLCYKCRYERERKDDPKYKASVKVARKTWQHTEKGKINNNQRNVRRRCTDNNRFPPLTEAEKTKLELYYLTAIRLGPKWCVDHIIPLSKGGLHHPDNLQILTRSINSKKADKLNFIPNSSECIRL